jgi:glycerol kinase
MDYSIFNFAVAAITAAKTMYNDMFPEEFVVEVDPESDETWLDAIDVLVSVTDETDYHMESVKAYVYNMV